MSGSIDPGASIGGLIYLLKNNLPTKFNTLDTEYNDGIVLDDVVNDDYYWAPLERYDRSPFIVLLGRDSTPEDPNSGFNLMGHTITLHFSMWSNAGATGTFYGISHTGVNRPLLPQELLAIKVYRSIRGIVELIRDNPTLPISGNKKAKFTLISRPAYQDFEVSVDSIFGRTGVIPIAAHVKG